SACVGRWLADRAGTGARFPLATDRAPMNTQRARKRFNRRKEPLLKSADQQAGSSLCATRLTTEPLLPNYAVFVEKYGQTQLRCVLGEAVNIDLRVSRFGKPPTICRRSSLRRRTMMSSSIRLLA